MKITITKSTSYENGINLETDLEIEDQGILSIWIPFEAIHNRREVYKLKDDKQVIEAIIKEHGLRNGGQEGNITIVWGSGIQLPTIPEPQIIVPEKDYSYLYGG